MKNEKRDKEGIIMWEYEPQTKKKHEIMKKYLEKWIPILGKYYGLNYFDCFGGCGQYYDKCGSINYGSPIIVAQIIEKHVEGGKNIAVIVIDKKKRNIENIKKIFKKLDIKIKKVIFIQGDFDNSINKILDEHSNLAPSFFFIDPFGFKIKLKTIKRIMQIKKSEIVLNFMFNAINRFMNIKQNKENMKELFGGVEWEKICQKDKSTREKKVLELYTKKLKEFVKFVSIFPFNFKNIDRTNYYLIHLTNHPLGCEIMRSCANEGYRGKSEIQKKLSDCEFFKEENLQNFILKNFKNKIDFGKLVEQILIEKNDYKMKEILKAIKGLEFNKKIQIERNPKNTSTGQKRESIKKEDILIFI